MCLNTLFPSSMNFVQSHLVQASIAVLATVAISYGKCFCRLNHHIRLLTFDCTRYGNIQWITSHCKRLFSSSAPNHCTEKENGVLGSAMAVPKEVLTHFHWKSISYYRKMNLTISVIFPAENILYQAMQPMCCCLRNCSFTFLFASNWLLYYKSTIIHFSGSDFW